jgi:hypothetical protein
MLERGQGAVALDVGHVPALGHPRGRAAARRRRRATPCRADPAEQGADSRRTPQGGR